MVGDGQLVVSDAIGRERLANPTYGDFVIAM